MQLKPRKENFRENHTALKSRTTFGRILTSEQLSPLSSWESKIPVKLVVLYIYFFFHVSDMNETTDADEIHEKPKKFSYQCNETDVNDPERRRLDGSRSSLLCADTKLFWAGGCM